MIESLKNEVEKIFKRSMAATLVALRTVVPKGRGLAEFSSGVLFSCVVVIV